MKYVDIEGRPIDEQQVDLSKGTLQTLLMPKENIEPVDNINKFAYSDDDYEKVYMYIPDKQTTALQPNADEILNVMLGVM